MSTIRFSFYYVLFVILCVAFLMASMGCVSRPGVMEEPDRSALYFACLSSGVTVTQCSCIEGVILRAGGIDGRIMTRAISKCVPGARESIERHQKGDGPEM